MEFKNANFSFKSGKYNVNVYSGNIDINEALSEVLNMNLNKYVENYIQENLQNYS